jgi:hypothetical protein
MLGIRAWPPLLAVVCALVLVATGCGKSGSANDSTKGRFVTAADQVCAAHVRAMMSWLDAPGSGAAWQRQAVQDEGIYEIMDRSIQRLSGLGPAPGPRGESFGGYLKTLKARASLYRLTSVAFTKRDTVFALQLEKRIDQIDAQGDQYAHDYGLRICGTGVKDLAKAFDDAGWTQP